jgi:hypothetical protein
MCCGACGFTLALVFNPTVEDQGRIPWFPPGWAWDEKIGEWYVAKRANDRIRKGKNAQALKAGTEFARSHIEPSSILGWIVQLPISARCPSCGFVNLFDPSELKMRVIPLTNRRFSTGRVQAEVAKRILRLRLQ